MMAEAKPKKRINTRRKGAKVENLIADVLRAKGWAVEVAKSQSVRTAGGRWIVKSHDIFGVFDLNAVRPEHVAYVQVHTTQRKGDKAAEKKRKIEEWIRGCGWVYSFICDIGIWYVEHRKEPDPNDGRRKIDMVRPSRCWGIEEWDEGDWMTLERFANIV